MRFPFPPSESDAPASSTETSEIAESDAELSAPSTAVLVEPEEVAPQPVEAVPSFAEAGTEADLFPEPGFAAPPLPAPRPRANRTVIAFPKPPNPEPEHHLADPVIPEQPRILDVPEELQAFPATPLLDGLQFTQHEQQRSAPAADHVELPLQPVLISQRLYAGIIDGALVLAGAGIFAGASYKLLPKLVLTKPLLLTGAAVPVLLWAVYQYLFLMYGGRTVGMRAAGIRLSSFKGQTPRWRQRRSRVIGLYFSTASLMMGLLWALVDVDTLCWHDRISQTYLTSVGSD